MTFIEILHKNPPFGYSIGTAGSLCHPWASKMLLRGDSPHTPLVRLQATYALFIYRAQHFK